MLQISYNASHQRISTSQPNIAIDDEEKKPLSLQALPAKKVTLTTQIIRDIFGREVIKKNEAGHYSFPRF